MQESFLKKFKDEYEEKLVLRYFFYFQREIAQGSPISTTPVREKDQDFDEKVRNHKARTPLNQTNSNNLPCGAPLETPDEQSSSNPIPYNITR